MKSLKHDPSNPLSVGFRVVRSFGKKHRVFLRSNTKLIVESVMQNLLHVIPVTNNTMFNWILQGKYTSFGMSLVANVDIFLFHSNYNTSIPRTTYFAREDCSGSIVTSKTSLDHSGSVIHNKWLNLLRFCHNIGL